MGAGLSNTLRAHVLRGWEEEGFAPRNVENEARVLARFAFIFAEAYPPAHLHLDRPGQPQSSTSSAPLRPRLRRPPWLEPSLLHVLLVTRSDDLAEVVLEGFRAAAPLAKIVEDPQARDGGALAAASGAGFHPFAFIDAELRVLRLWRIGEADLLADAKSSDEARALPFFDLVVWIVDGVEGQQAAVAGRSADTPLEIQKKLEELRAAKRTAVEAEDFERARTLKEQEAALGKRLEAAQSAEEAAAKESREVKEARIALEGELQQAKAAKKVAVEAEDFKEAQRWKLKEGEIEACMAQLHLGKEKATDSSPAAHEEGDPENLQVALLAAEGPPVMVVGAPSVPRGLRSSLARAGLPPHHVWALPQKAANQRPGLSAEPAFWALTEAALKLISEGRGFPEEIPPTLPSDVKLGATVRLRLTDDGTDGKVGKARSKKEPPCGTVIGYEEKAATPLFLVRLWDGEVMHVVREQMTLLAFKLGSSSPVQLNNMQRMRVKLKGLTANPGFNGREGEVEDEVSEGRYTVQFKGGGNVAVKPENMDILEPAAPELQGSVGLVDAKDGARSRYKVLVVKTTNRTEERSRIRLCGLQGRPELNGHEAVITSYNMQTERFTVKLVIGGDEIAIRRLNFEFLDPVRIEATSLSLPGDRVDYYLDPEDEDMLFDK